MLSGLIGTSPDVIRASAYLRNFSASDAAALGVSTALMTMSILAALGPLVQNKLGQLQVSRMSDLEIRLFVGNENDFAADPFDRGNLIRYRNFVGQDRAIRDLKYFALENLRRLHGVELMSVH